MLVLDQSTTRIMYCVRYVFSAFCDVIVAKCFQFMQNSLHWYPSPCIKNDYKIGILGNFGRMHGLLTSEACFLRTFKNAFNSA